MIDVVKFSKLNFNGKGGKEHLFQECLIGKWERISRPLYDFLNTNTGDKIELKKQKDLQWLDPSKYGSLTEDEKQISMCFLLYDDTTGKPQILFRTPLQELLNSLGWDQSRLKDAAEYKGKYPKDQIKSGVKVRDYFARHRDSVEILYEANNDVQS